MRKFRYLTLIALVATIVCLTGCTKSGPPSALSDEQWGPSLTKAFEKAPALTKNLVQEAIVQFDKKDYVGIGSVLGTILAKPALTDSQRATATLAQINLNEKMQTAQEKGDVVATEVQKFQMLTK